MVQQWDDITLCTLPYYHGYLPREDIPAVLKEHGDFLVRSTVLGVKEGEKAVENRQREVVISVLVDPQNLCNGGPIEKEAKEEMIRSIVVQQIKNKVTIDNEKMFDDLPYLIRYYHQVQIRLEKRSVSLMRGCALCRWEFYHKDVKIGKLLGKGAFGEVHRGTLKRKRKKVITVAVKSLTAKGGNTRETIRDMMREARLMRGLSHPNVVKIYGVAVTEQPLYIVLELVKGGGLDAYLKKHATIIDQDEKLQMVMGACWGMAFLHRGQILHRDVAARNCLYDESKNVKISDFGLSRTGMIYKIKTSCKMPVKWMAPESINSFEFSQKTDVYSFGVLIWEIFACKDPYEDLSNADAKARIKAGKPNEFPDTTPKALTEYVKDKMWDLEPSKRANMQNIQAWLENYTGLQLIIPSDADASLIQNSSCSTLRTPQASESKMNKMDPQSKMEEGTDKDNK